MIEYLEEESLMLEIYGRQRKSSELRMGSSLDAYTIADKRRLSSMSVVSTLAGSTCSSYTQQSISGVVLEEEHEDQEEEDQCGQHTHSNDCYFNLNNINKAFMSSAFTYITIIETANMKA